MQIKSAVLLSALIFATMSACNSDDVNDVPTDIPDGGYAPGSQAFMEPCNEDVDCAVPEGADAAICQLYQARGAKFCSRACTLETAATDCPLPSNGCNNMKVCKAP